jgi:hypothetical protein
MLVGLASFGNVVGVRRGPTGNRRRRYGLRGASARGPRARSYESGPRECGFSGRAWASCIALATAGSTGAPSPGLGAPRLGEGDVDRTCPRAGIQSRMAVPHGALGPRVRSRCYGHAAVARRARALRGRGLAGRPAVRSPPAGELRNGIPCWAGQRIRIHREYSPASRWCLKAARGIAARRRCYTNEAGRGIRLHGTSHFALGVD